MAQLKPDDVFCMDPRHDTPCLLPCGGCTEDACDRRKRKKFKNFDKRSQHVLRERYLHQYRAVRP